VLAALREHGVLPAAVSLDNIPSALARRAEAGRAGRPDDRPEAVVGRAGPLAARAPGRTTSAGWGGRAAPWGRPAFSTAPGGERCAWARGRGWWFPQGRGLPAARGEPQR